MQGNATLIFEKTIVSWKSKQTKKLAGGRVKKMALIKWIFPYYISAIKFRMIFSKCLA
jgi:hypothetical protein